MRKEHFISNSNRNPYIGLSLYIFVKKSDNQTCDHRVWKTGLPVRSAVLKPHAGRLVVGWVTTSESRLSYVKYFCFLSSDWTSDWFFLLCDMCVQCRFKLVYNCR